MSEIRCKVCGEIVEKGIVRKLMIWDKLGLSRNTEWVCEVCIVKLNKLPQIAIYNGKEVSYD